MVAAEAAVAAAAAAGVVAAAAWQKAAACLAWPVLDSASPAFRRRRRTRLFSNSASPKVKASDPDYESRASREDRFFMECRTNKPAQGHLLNWPPQVILARAASLRAEKCRLKTDACFRCMRVGSRRLISNL